MTAALYLARFHLKVRLFDSGDARIDWIPRTNNVAGYADGIAGRELRQRMRDHATRYGVQVEDAEVTSLSVGDEGFSAGVAGMTVAARAVLLATGVVNHQPDVADGRHDEALARHLLRYCPVCDGFEVTDKRVGVFGTGERGVKEAMFLRGFTADLTLLPPADGHRLSDNERAALAAAGIAVADGRGAPLVIDGDRIVAPTGDMSLAFDSIYPALGSTIRSTLAIAAGAVASEDGCMEVSDHQETSVPNLFAAGDVVYGLDQIASAMGQAAVAATTIRNRLSEERPLRR
ncbi:thioredoxin reductase (NADPH) [Sphingomonas jejuensis]|uniref:Thioredoxin reductase n=1 Tax=Sphingomonas jejuensis TaxID=904715 RepID=A0ABX0XJ65_9SPHN|nr:thioredoxin reductase (NADPH) [Sphingomonas jejuensis]